VSNDPDHPDTTVTHRVEVDQEHVGSFQNAFGNVNTGAQWIGLGTYYFKAGHQGKVTLNNATGENDQQLAADGIEFAPLVPPKYAFTLDEDTTPAQMLAGDRATVKLKLTNTSSFPWPAEGLQAVQIIYRWLDSQGHAVLVSSPVSLAQDLPIKGSVTSTIEVQAPVQAGTYTLQWDLLRGTEVFSQQGAHLENHSIIVSDPTSEPGVPPVDASPVAPEVPPVTSPGSGPIAPPGVPPGASPGSRPIAPPAASPVASPAVPPGTTPTAPVVPTVPPGELPTTSPGPGSALQQNRQQSDWQDTDIPGFPDMEQDQEDEAFPDAARVPRARSPASGG
jgi:hypothetical protein